MKEKTIEGFRLSPQQRHLWLLQQSEESPFYQTVCGVLIDGNLESTVLKQALRKLSGQNEILRTTFQRLSGMVVPIQVVNNDSSLSFEEYDFQGSDPAEQNAQIEALATRLRRQHIDSAKGPHWRTCLIALSPGRHQLLLAASALCLDISALRNLARKLSYCYTTMLNGEELPEEPLQFADLAEWQNQLLESEEAEVGKKYWHTQPITAFSDSRLPFERHSDNQIFEPETLIKISGSEIFAQLENVAGNHKVSLATFLLSCWQTLCWRFTGEPDHICIGTAFDGRQYDELRSALGVFEKYLPLCSQLEAGMCFSEVLRQIDTTKHEAELWQECFTGEQAAADVASEAPYYAPLNFSFEEKPEAWETAGIFFSINRQYSCGDRFRLKLSCKEQEGLLVTEFHFDSGLFQYSDVERFSEHFYTLLESAINNPEITITSLNILNERQCHQLLTELNDTRTDYAETKCFHELFEEQAERTPDNIAVIFGSDRLTYAELNARSNQLARELQNIGVGPESLAGLFVERSPEMIIAALGVMKAGGAYLPFDPSYPDKYLKTIIHDSQVTAILTQHKLAEILPETKAKIVNLDSAGRDAITQHASENIKNPARPDNLAYVIYTSGSTGKPKGVMITHRGLVNYLKWCIKAYKVEEGSGAPVHSPFTFDLTITGLFSPLLVGRSVTLLAEDQGIDALGEALVKEGDFSLVKITPAHLEVLNRQLRGKRILSKIGVLVIGGEALSGESLSFWISQASETRLINEYGPTETVVGACVYEVLPNLTYTGTIPIGRPIGNTQIYVLDREYQPVAVGVPGEIYIGGVGLARGYLNRAELTAESFIPNPFGREGGERLYRTGDVGRYLADGQIDFLGRADHQVKIRGYRIELGEIESILSEHPAVREAVVVVKEERANDKRLVVYLVSGEVERPADIAVREYLRQRLPEHMVPGVFVWLERLPLTPNGKVDRRALSAQDIVQPKTEQNYLAARTPVEEKLVEIWQEVLGSERVGVNDNFFELGGHSLLATQVISRVRTEFNVEVPLQRIFEFPTIADLGTIIVQQPPLPNGENTTKLLIELEKLSEEEVREILARDSQLEA